ncbi:hypothetical protein VP01_940g2 [Puccinia sorghi]|uniref:Uncharacterized protein n=1 Tax=Puccinia sorghi TaxID=27349 RepID=A0A0L6U770_9BASI|nr:hypothetical protein VP01_940g2 [Puccinia sorghi]
MSQYALYSFYSLTTKVHSTFEPTRLNSILWSKELASKYPIKEKIEEAYLIVSLEQPLPMWAALRKIVSQQVLRWTSCMIPSTKNPNLNIPGKTVLCWVDTKRKEYWPSIKILNSSGNEWDNPSCTYQIN